MRERERGTETRAREEAERVQRGGVGEKEEEWGDMRRMRARKHVYRWDRKKRMRRRYAGFCVDDWDARGKRERERERDAWKGKKGMKFGGSRWSWSVDRCQRRTRRWSVDARDPCTNRKERGARKRKKTRRGETRKVKIGTGEHVDVGASSYRGQRHTYICIYLYVICAYACVCMMNISGESLSLSSG